MNWKRFFNYFSTKAAMTASAKADPEVEMQQAIREAENNNKSLRNQAAQVMATSKEIEMKLNAAVESAAKSKSMTIQALKNVEEAQKRGDAAEVARWERSAETQSMRLRTFETSVEALKAQLGTAREQSDQAIKMVNQNAMRLSQLSTKRMELMGKLQQAKMQEQVNKTLTTLNRPMGGDSQASMGAIEDKINQRMALASSHAELEAGSLEGSERELEESMMEIESKSRLEDLRKELGLGFAPTAELTEGESAKQAQATDS